MHPSATGALTLALIALLAAAPAAALTVSNTDDTGPGSLRQVLAGASDGDTIDFSLPTPATITLASELAVTHSVTITGPGVDRLTIDGDSVGRVFHVSPFTTATITDLTVANGDSGTDGGGCIFNDGGDLTLQRVVVRQCTGAYGAGILNDASSNAATLHLADSTVQDNQTNNASGGGLYNDATTNTATVQIERCTFRDNGANVAGSDGGGILNSGFNGHGTITVNASTISGNTATDEGGGIANTADSGGQATLRIASCTFAGNAAPAGGGISNRVFQNGGTAEIEIGNTIVRAGLSGGTFANTVGTITSAGFNLASDAAGGDASTGPGGFLDGTSDLRNTNPLLGSLQANGGVTFTHALTTGSPAIDRGRRDTIAALTDTVDQRGNPRPADDPAVANAGGGDGNDIGAFEVQPPRDLAVTALKVPKSVGLKTGGGPVTKTLKVTIQNRGAQTETVPDLATLDALVDLDGNTFAMSACSAPVATLVAGKPKLPATIKSKKKLTVSFAATFTCAADPAKTTTKDPGHTDFFWTATVHRDALGDTDAHADDDVCPRPSLPNGVDPRPNPAKPIKDTGCGGKFPDKTLGAAVTTDVVVK